MTCRRAGGPGCRRGQGTDGTTLSVRLITCERVVPFGIACSRCSQWTCGTQCPTIMRAARTFFFLLRGGVLSHRGGGAEHWKWSVPSDQLLHASHSHIYIYKYTWSTPTRAYLEHFFVVFAVETKLIFYCPAFCVIHALPHKYGTA